MTFDIKQPEFKRKTVFARVDEKLYNEIEMLVKKHKVDRSVVIRSLIELGLKNI